MQLKRFMMSVTEERYEFLERVQNDRKRATTQET